MPASRGERTITGASQKTQANGNGEWEAWYVCHKCGEEFAASHYACRDEKKAREESDTRFDVYRWRYCYACGYKLTDEEPIPDDKYISLLNNRITNLEQQNKTLRDTIAKGNRLRGSLRNPR